MVCDEIALVTNCVLDDSRRVDELFHKKAPLIEKRRTYAAICTEKYSNESPTDGLTDDFARRNFSVARDKHWKILATNVGRNIRALFDSNLTNPKNQNLNGNISIDGGLADVIDLTTMKKPSDIHSTINHAFGGLSNYYEVAGYEAQDFFKSTPFANLLKNCLGGEAGAQLAKRLKGELAGMGRGDLGLCIGKAAGLLTDELVKLKGSTERSVYQMPDEEVLELLKQDVGLRKACDLTPSSLGELERSMVSGIPLSRMTPRGFVQVDPRKELDKHRARVDDQLRTETVTSMKENGLELSRLYAERYDPQNSLSL